MQAEQQHPSSFRDPHGTVVMRNGEIYRQINKSFTRHYDLLLSSRLYRDLVDSNLLVSHTEESHESDPKQVYKLIKPQRLPFISYPYEWSFGQLKNAALTTLRIQRIAITHGLSLRDCSAYNIQFMHGHPILMDTLSFEEYREGEPWVAYRQFCQHFLAPLALMSYKDVRLNQLLRIHIDGIPLDLASALLPTETRLIPSLLWHIHLHARSQRYFSDSVVKKRSHRFVFRRQALIGLIDNLHNAINRLSWNPKGTEWVDYYQHSNYSHDAFVHKQQVLSEYLETLHPGTVWDLGANVGVFSRLASKRGIYTVAFDADPAAVEVNYKKCTTDRERCLLPLILDLTNPSPSIGWHNAERQSLIQRGPADTVLALALIHHLCISNNVPFTHLARFLATLGSALVIEFVPKSDVQVQRLLASREDVFHDYTQQQFEYVFSRYFTIISSQRLRDSERTLYHMRTTGVK